jgi:hypothetical protein
MKHKAVFNFMLTWAGKTVLSDGMSKAQPNVTIIPRATVQIARIRPRAMVILKERALKLKVPKGGLGDSVEGAGSVMG